MYSFKMFENYFNYINFSNTKQVIFSFGGWRLGPREGTNKTQRYHGY